jgi:hypothetical protein
MRKIDITHHRACRGIRPRPLRGPAAPPSALKGGLLLLLAPLHVSTLQNNKRLKLKLIITFLKAFLILRYKFQKFITFRLGRARCPLLGSPDDGEEADAALPDAAPPGALSPGVAPLEVAPAAALDSSDAAAPRPLDTAVPAAAAAAPRLAVNAAPTAAPVLGEQQ